MPPGKEMTVFTKYHSDYAQKKVDLTMIVGLLSCIYFSAEVRRSLVIEELRSGQGTSEKEDAIILLISAQRVLFLPLRLMAKVTSMISGSRCNLLTRRVELISVSTPTIYQLHAPLRQPSGSDPCAAPYLRSELHQRRDRR